MSRWIDLVIPRDLTRLIEAGPTVQIQFSNTRDRLNRSQSPSQVLIDAGSRSNFVDEKLALDYGFALNNGTTRIADFGSPRTSNMYLGGVLIPSIDHWQFGRFVGAELSGRYNDLAVALGRGFLAKCFLDWNGSSGIVRSNLPHTNRF